MMPSAPVRRLSKPESLVNLNDPTEEQIDELKATGDVVESLVETRRLLVLGTISSLIGLGVRFSRIIF